MIESYSSYYSFILGNRYLTIDESLLRAYLEDLLLDLLGVEVRILRSEGTPPPRDEPCDPVPIEGS